jgi:hypothetical protein
VSDARQRLHAWATKWSNTETYEQEHVDEDDVFLAAQNALAYMREVSDAEMARAMREKPITPGSYVIFTAGGRSHEGKVVSVFTSMDEPDTAHCKSADTGQHFNEVPLGSIRHYYAANH